MSTDQDAQVNPPIVPGALNYHPPTPVASESVASLIPEVPIQQEVQPVPEVPTFVSIQPQPTQPEVHPIAHDTQITPSDVKVVDMREHVDDLTKVDPDADALTKEADEKEEEFIEGVELAHGSH